MNLIRLETRVLEAVQAVLEGQSIEDDLVEVKGQWPVPDQFVRQLAGTANRAAGPEIVVILGVDETEHRLTELAGVDPEKWWPQVRARFDEQTPPELVHHLRFAVPSGGSVVALVFETNRAPYVLKSADGTPPHREVPMRSGTTTRSAKRSELIRLLAPHITTPSATALDAGLNIEVHRDPSSQHQKEPRISAHATVKFFLEHLGPGFIMLPHHSMRAHVDIAGETFPLPLKPPVLFRPREAPIPPPSLHGVEQRRDGILATGPGECLLNGNPVIPYANAKPISEAKFAQIRLSIPITGTPRGLSLTFPLLKTAKAIQNTEYQEFLGYYGFVAPEESGGSIET